MKISLNVLPFCAVRNLGVAVALVLCLALAACSKPEPTKFKNGSGTITVEFKGDKVYVTNPTVTQPIEGSFTVSGNVITLHKEGLPDVTLTKQPDGSLAGLPNGDVLKPVTP